MEQSVEGQQSPAAQYRTKELVVSLNTDVAVDKLDVIKHGFLTYTFNMEAQTVCTISKF